MARRAEIIAHDVELKEWLESMESLLQAEGPERAKAIFRAVQEYLADENVLLLDENTEVVLAHYKTGWRRPLLVICRYPSAKRAREAFVRFSRDFFSPGIDLGRGGARRVGSLGARHGVLLDGFEHGCSFGQPGRRIVSASLSGGSDGRF